jgi:hypothetical protein
MDMLNIPSLKVAGIHETEYDYHITAEVKLPPIACPASGMPISTLVKLIGQGEI